MPDTSAFLFIAQTTTTEPLAPGLDGQPAWLLIAFFGFIGATYLWNSRRRRSHMQRSLTHEEWEARLRANDPDLARPDDPES